MGTTADKLNLLLNTKADIKSALTEKGQNPGDVFSEYADKIRAIEPASDLSDELATQDNLIAQIRAALIAKGATE